MRGLLAALALSFCTMLSADAQQASSQQKTTREALTADGKWFLSSVIGYRVYDAQGSSLNARFSDALIDEKGAIHSYIISYGGFLGIGEIQYVVPAKFMVLGKDTPRRMALTVGELRTLPIVQDK